MTFDSYPSRHYLVALLGARMNYAVPRILHQTGQLSHFYTDFCASQGWPRWLKSLPDTLKTNSVQRLLERDPKDIPADQITAFNRLGLSYGWRLRRAQHPDDFINAFLWSGQKFCELIVKRGLGEANAVYTFNSAGLEILQRARQQGCLAVMEQTIAPKAIEYRLLQQEQNRFPDWEAPTDLTPAQRRYIEREQAEWQKADRIICGSEFVQQGIDSLSGLGYKCIVVPYGIDPKPDNLTEIEPKIPHSPLRILTVGTVGLRKGSPYVLAAAKQLKTQATFRLVGNLQSVPAAIQAELCQHLELIGPVRRSEMYQHYHWADVFLLPSLCEGSATVIYEALSYGLPIICTPNSGSTVRHNHEGLIIAPSSTEVLVKAIVSLIGSSRQLVHFSNNAFRRSQEFTLISYSRRLAQALIL